MCLIPEPNSDHCRSLMDNQARNPTLIHQLHNRGITPSSAVLSVTESSSEGSPEQCFQRNSSSSFGWRLTFKVNISGGVFLLLFVTFYLPCPTICLCPTIQCMWSWWWYPSVWSKNAERIHCLWAAANEYLMSLELRPLNIKTRESICVQNI